MRFQICGLILFHFNLQNRYCWLNRQGFVCNLKRYMITNISKVLIIYKIEIAG
jgi:hypothetical protein